MPREGWGAKKKSREKGGGRNEIRVDGELRGGLGRHGRKPEEVGRAGSWAVTGMWLQGGEGGKERGGEKQMSNTREKASGGLQFSAG